jgi:hyperosmotically inducible periplasmic protein
MNAIDLLKVMVVAGCVAVTSSAWSQTSDSMANPSAGTATNTKAMKKADRLLARKVRGAMAHAQGFDVSNVFVKSRSGAVTLSGTVPDNGQIAQGGEIAKNVPGVNSVNNRLTLAVPNGGGN